MIKHKAAEILETDEKQFISKDLKDTIIIKLEELEELFQSVSNGKKILEAAIADKGVMVSKEGEVATFEELVAAILSIQVEEPLGKFRMSSSLNSRFGSQYSEDNTLREMSEYVMELDLDGLLLKRKYQVKHENNLDIDRTVNEPKTSNGFEILNDVNINCTEISNNKIKIDKKIEAKDIVDLKLI